MPSNDIFRIRAVDGGIQNLFSVWGNNADLADDVLLPRLVVVVD